MEHNSVLRCIVGLGRLGVTYSIFDSSLPLDESIPALIRPDTKYIITTAVSNVTGAEIDLYRLSQIAKDHSIGLIIDASQLLGHKKVNIKDIHFSALCAPGHKGLLGQMGVGFVVFSDTAAPAPLIEGGSGYDSLNEQMPDYLPERIEAGTLPVPSIVSLERSVRYIEEYGISCIERKLSELCLNTAEMLSSISKIKIYGAENGIVAFNVLDVPSMVVSDYLDKQGVCVRGGLHCSPSAHKSLGTLDQGIVRISFSIFNSYSQINKLYHYLKSEYK